MKLNENLIDSRRIIVHENTRLDQWCKTPADLTPVENMIGVKDTPKTVVNPEGVPAEGVA